MRGYEILCWLQEIAKLGEVVRLSQVQVTSLSGDKHDRIFVLFPSLLVMLSMSPRLSGYQYEVSRTNDIDRGVMSLCNLGSELCKW